MIRPFKGSLAWAIKARDTISKTTNALPNRGQKEVKARLEEFEKIYSNVAETLEDAYERSR